jgi:uncharacterized protein (DUF885 family)
MAGTLAALIDAFIAEEMEESPVRATQLGIDGHDDRLGELAAEDFARRARNEDAWYERFLAVGGEGFGDGDGLSVDDTIDRDLVLSTIRGRQLMRDWEVWRRDPAVYLGPCLTGVFSLFLNRTHAEPELVRCASERLYAVPSVLDAAMANLEPSMASKLMVERAMAQCRAGITYARHLVPAEISDPTLKASLASAGEMAAGALEGFWSFLAELWETASGEWAIGEKRYSALLTDKELLGYGAVEMRERGRVAYAEIAAEMEELAVAIDGSRDWRALLERLNQDHPESPSSMRYEYAAWTEKARRFLHETGLVTMPDGEECRVEPSPPFQRPVLAVASYSAPPAFKPSLRGTFFVPFPPDGTTAEEVQKRLETNSRSSIPTIAVHEAYPGHHWHLVTVHANPRPVRKVFATSYFTEGWALYAERLMREHGFFTDPRHELCHLDARLFRAARIVVDTSLHVGDMTVEEAVSFMSTKASLTEPTARAEVGRYCSWPTQAASYLTGALEIERIRSRFLDAGRGTLREFNDRIAGSGMLPIELAERAVMSG